VEVGEVVNIFQTGEDASFQASFAGGKPRNCQKGIACGGTCIAKGKTCSKKASAGQKAKAKEITASLKGKNAAANAKVISDLHAKSAKLKDTKAAAKAAKKNTVLGLPASASLLDHKKALIKVKNETGGTGAKYERAKAEYDKRAGN
jgi:hypothetical protein